MYPYFMSFAFHALKNINTFHVEAKDGEETNILCLNIVIIKA